MRRKSFFISFFAVFICFAQSSFSQEINNTHPLLMEEKNYTEYWEQYFYLEDGSLVTSQYLVANFPWPVGKDHGIMVGTLVTPSGELYVIKNGRKPGKWGFKQDALDMFIHTHSLSGSGDNLSVHLENTMAIVDLNLTSTQAELNHQSYSSEDGFIETSIYAPRLRGSGNWQLGPEAGFKEYGPVHNVESATGFGFHVLMTDKVDMLVKNWTRVLALGSEGPIPFLSAITRPDEAQDIIFRLFDGDAVVDIFSDVKISYQDMSEEKDASYPKSIEISASGEKGEIKGTINFSKKFDHFNLKEQLNFFEKTFAKSNPSVTNFRYLSDYNLVYKTSEGENILKGKALSEYTDILPARKAPVKRRRSRR